jgi:protein ImuB
MVCCLVSETACDPSRLATVARACSPRVESCGDRAVVFDAGGLGRVIGSPADIAREVHAMALEEQVPVRVAIAPTRAVAWLLAHERPGVTVVDRRADPAEAIASLPIRALTTLPGPGSRRKFELVAIATFARWGLRTLGDIARLPRADVRTRLGADGVRLHQAACGEDAEPLVPAGEPAAFLERCVLEWPIDGLEPLTFVLARMCEALAVSLERADRGAIVITTSLQLVTRATYERTLHLPAPMREPKTLRTLIVLDLESHPPDAGIDAITVAVDVVPGRIVQGSLLERAAPAPEQIATLTARLGALMGESRVGAPVVLDSHDDRVNGMRMFSSGSSGSSGSAAPVEPEAPAAPVVRRFRLPVAARVVVERGGPVRISPASSAIPGGLIVNRAGPWRSSGRWWTSDHSRWDRDEWDIEIAGGGCYRLAKDRKSGQWEIDGEID